MSNFTKATIKHTDKSRLIKLQKRLMGNGKWVGEASTIGWMLDLSELFPDLWSYLRIAATACDNNTELQQEIWGVMDKINQLQQAGRPAKEQSDE